MASSKPSSGKQRGSEKPPAPPPEIDGARARQRDTQRGGVSRRTAVVAAVVAAAIVVAGSLAFLFLTDGWHSASSGGSSATTAATFVGSETCAGCHQAEAQLWRGSQHQLAMRARKRQISARRFRRCEFRLLRRAIPLLPQGWKVLRRDRRSRRQARRRSRVKYTFGVDPLQQYLVEFPDGRLQALSLAWDSRPKDQGGQRWFHLYPDEEIKHDDVLHWTRLNQNWNFMCAECHSTGVRKNYDAATDRFATSFAEISVGCEACHGQGSRHVGWARGTAKLVAVRQERRPEQGTAGQVRRARTVSPGRSIPNTATRGAASRPRSLRKEVETCGLCHARRGEFSEDWVPGRSLSDTHVVSPLARGLYHADGQMLDEVYNYGSFKQSRMFAAGVTCSDCHEPHSAQASCAGRRRLPAMPRRRQIRRGRAPPPRGGGPAARLRVVPHAGPHLHGGR